MSMLKQLEAQAGNTAGFTLSQLIELLGRERKAERRRVRRMVRKLGKQAEKVRQQDAYFCDGYQSACDDILAALKEGR